MHRTMNRMMKYHGNISHKLNNIIAHGLYIIILFSIGMGCGSTNISKVSKLESPKNKIMPLGASRVEGNSPTFESYRYELWKLLVDDGWSFDFIGTMEDKAQYPNYSGKSFDNDHEGRGGWTSAQIRAELNNWLKSTGPPDIVLLSSPGGNDALQGSTVDAIVENLNSIVDILQEENENVTIVIEQGAPAKAHIMTPEFTMFFNSMKKNIMEISRSQTTTHSRVLVVDMFTGFKDDLLADDLHYNKEGAKIIANKYYKVLSKILEK